MPKPAPSHPAVLIVDDDSNGNRVIADHLRFSGYESMSLFSGQEAMMYLLALPNDRLPQLILLDVLMPGMNGCQVLQEIRQHVETKNIPVILLSVLSQDEISERLSCPCSGYTDYINKPFDMHRVVQAVQGIVHA